MRTLIIPLILLLIGGCAQPPQEIKLNNKTAQIIDGETESFRTYVDHVFNVPGEKNMDPIYTKAYHEMR